MRASLSERLSKREGSEVEICYRKKGFNGVWYKAIIERKQPKSRRIELCLRLLKDDSCSPLTDDNVLFRPVPPAHLQARISITKGCVVDADHEGGWRTGFVVKEIEDDQCLVLFDSPPDIIQFRRKHLRPHLDWVDQRWWVRPQRNVQFLRSLADESMFASGTMVEVRNRVWVPAMIIKEVDDKKYIVKFCNKSIPNKTVDLRCVRPFKMPEGHNIRKSKRVELKHISDLNETADESVSPVLASPVITATPLKQTESKTQENTFPKKTIQPVRDQDCFVNDSTQENESSEDNNRKRKREQNLSYVSNAGRTRAKETTNILPFEKTLPTWKTFESMEAFKTVPQSPHFSPLVETTKNSREMSAVGMMYTYSVLLEDVKNMQLFNPASTLESFNDSFVELEKHGFDVKAPQTRIQKLLSLKDRQAKKMEELEGAEKEIEEKERENVEIGKKILELQRLKEEADKEITQMKSCATTIGQQLEDMEIQFQTTASAPW